MKIALLPGKTELFDLTADPGGRTTSPRRTRRSFAIWRPRLIAYAKQQKMSEWLKAQPDYLGAQGKTVFDPDFDIDDGGLPHQKSVLPREVSTLFERVNIHDTYSAAHPVRRIGTFAALRLRVPGLGPRLCRAE